MASTQAAEPPAADDAPSAPAPPLWQQPLIRWAAIGVIGLGVLGTGAWLVLPRVLGRGEGRVAEATVEEPVKATVPLGAVVVNLHGEGRRYLRVGVSLGVTSPKETKEVEEAKAQLLDLLISVLSSAPEERLASEPARSELKKALLARVRDELGLKKVARIYFTEFVLQ